jgi:endonuclease-3
VKTPAEVQAVIEALGHQHPNANTELRFSNAFELLAATILSAQATDAGVNQITPELFATYPTPGALAAAPVADVERIIHATGFFRQKTRALMGMAAAVVERHGGEVPRTMEALVTLPGVGRKTANVVLGHALGVPGFPVDRHVLRVSNRLGLADSDDAARVEQQLTGALPPAWWTRASDTLILHGRRICRPTPLCDQCAAHDRCDLRRREASKPTKASKPAKASRPTKASKPAKASRPAKARTRTKRTTSGPSR